MNRELINERGRELGYIVDLVISQDKKVVQMIVASEDYLGEEIYAAFDYKTIKYNPYGIVTEMSIEEFRNLQMFHYMETKKKEQP